ncbi:hypothetical protein X798_04529 [Onchocerca flexuosa]|uniref:Uncharacterized protein n=2 Tax=Onchocerca flexuosa TaxID=387005 RepID=A0A183H965_9BILA|nr:hypothetical protein X798_04529 [Onchocerca flexuosa]VDO38637.1 unnamed protein product [Onchocerca flexuosa]
MKGTTEEAKYDRSKHQSMDRSLALRNTLHSDARMHASAIIASLDVTHSDSKSIDIATFMNVFIKTANQLSPKLLFSE